ncbi:MAG TPA: TonB-dependent receptor [Steroidobacteraceae bacterium]|nr:TonB-dependent receptor [Steroidobacteraceae bacterium]
MAADNSGALDEVVVTGKRLDEAREGIETKTGASTYVIDADAITASPGGDNTLLNQVVLQAPSVAQDSFGQFHVRGDHNDLQYRLNGIILPEGISVFGQSLSPRLISSLKLITGALPAEYGLRTAGIIDMTTKSGVRDPGGSVSLYGGSHSTFEPSFDYGGSSGTLNYFVSGDFLRSDLGIESPDGSSSPLHDHTTQYHGFGYLEDILDDSNRLSLIVGSSTGKFQIPNQRGLQPSLGLTVNGQTDYPSENLDENQRELTHYAVLSWQHAQGALDWQSSLTSRYSSLTYTPDALGDLLYDGITQNAYKRDVAFSWQTDASYKMNDAHTLRAGWYVQRDTATSDTTSQVLPVNDAGDQTTDMPVTIVDNGSQDQWIESLYVQDEWKAASTLTINYGLRFDHLAAYTTGTQVSPRLNAVWKPATGTTVHAGYSRYFTPPPFELVGSESIAKFANTTAAPEVAVATPPEAERADYFDVGIEQQLHDTLTLGIDSYYRKSKNLIDEGQFGAPIILTPFNYRDGIIYGVELTANYTYNGFSAYGNLAFQSAQGRGIETAQFNFGQDDLDYIANHYIHLDHEQKISGSAGVSYVVRDTRISADVLLGTGLRADLTLPDGSGIPNGDHLPSYTQVNLGVSHVFHLTNAGTITARFDVINAFDKVYQIRNGTGVGVGASQFGPRRGLFFGISKSL